MIIGILWGMMRYNYTLDDIEARLPRRSWWALLAILPLAKRVSLALINYTDIKPNTITLGSFVIALLASLFFIKGTYLFLVMGAILFELNYLLDCVDGSVARIKRFQCPLGAYMDNMFDRLRILILIIALCYGQWRVSRTVDVIILGIIYLGMNNLIIMSRALQKRVLEKFELNAKSGVELVSRNTSGHLIKKVLSKWLNFTYDRNVMPYWHDVESDTFVFFLGPLLNKSVEGLIIGIGLAASTVILLNAAFIMSIRGRNYVQPGDQSDNTRSWER